MKNRLRNTLPAVGVYSSSNGYIFIGSDGSKLNGEGAGDVVFGTSTDVFFYKRVYFEQNNLIYFGGNLNRAVLAPATNFAQLVLSFDSTQLGRQLVIGAHEGTGNDYDHATQTNPTLFIHSATDPDTNNTQWGSLAHDQTNFVIDAGTGTVNIVPDVDVNGTTITLDADSAAVKILCGSATPEGAVTANVGSLFLRTDGGASTTLYVKESGTGNTGWVAK